MSFPGGAVIKNLPTNAGGTKDTGSIPGSGRCPGVVNGNPLQYSCMENSMDRGACWAILQYEYHKVWMYMREIGRWDNRENNKIIKITEQNTHCS